MGHPQEMFLCHREGVVPVRPGCFHLGRYAVVTLCVILVCLEPGTRDEYRAVLYWCAVFNIIPVETPCQCRRIYFPDCKEYADGDTKYWCCVRSNHVFPKGSFWTSPLARGHRR